jgi:catechol 2,3-dioxygenase-like lactoylglutathione lyase family enzyme
MNAVQKLSRIALVSREPDRLASFYQSAFGFVRGDETQLAGTALQSLLGIPGAKARLIPLRLGGQTIELLGIDPEGEVYPADVPAWSNLFQHFAIVVSSMSAAYAKLSAQAGWKPISTEGPQALAASSGGVTAFKFRDPEGHPLELLAFPSGAVPERWQGSDVTGFLGIDHSAISVADTSQSIDFYRRLGLQRSGGSCNTGPEQDKLDGTRGSIVEVTALAPVEVPPHVELLCYRNILDRNRKFSGVNDVAATQLILSTHSTAALHALYTQTADALVSGPVPFEDGVVRAMMRDPDGHLLRLESPM